MFVVLLISLILSSLNARFLIDKQQQQQYQQSNHLSEHKMPPMSGTIWTHFQCNSRISPFIGVGFGCYCPGAWCSNNNQCCSQMCYKKTCY